MKVLHGYRDLGKNLKDPIVAIGIFDGIHIGHKRVIKKVLNSRDGGRDKVVMTFDPHPLTVLNPSKKPPRIMSLEHRLFIFEKMGIDAVVVLRFTDFLAMMPPEEFVNKVIKGMGTRRIYVGGNFHFGRAQSGNINTLKEICKKYDIDVRIVPSIKQRGRTVSSTWLRQLIKKGNIKRAEILLRRPVSVYGHVVKGDERGKRLGIPTANIDPHHEVIPPPGVYAVKVDLEGSLYNGVLNIGFKPTYYGSKLKKRKEPYIEVHILNYSGDIYGHTMEIFFIKKLRREKKFKNDELLVRQIKGDIDKAERLLTSKRIIHRIRKYKNL